MTNIILCGGSGTRLWPISRQLMPKQYIKLFGKESLFQKTLLRNYSLTSQQLIIANNEQYFTALDQVEELKLPQRKYILEPIGRNTAAAIALACLSLPKEEIVLITPSDHLIENNDSYSLCINRASQLASLDYLVTFGITPSFPETGFGYIEAKGENVLAFHEKPDFKTASTYLSKNSIANSIHYYWNSGMFCFKAGNFLDELQALDPKIFDTAREAYSHAKKTDNLLRITLEKMLDIPENSIDYSVMEKSSRVKVVPADIGWSDLGSFEALYEHMPKDTDVNTIYPNHINIGSKNNLILGDSRVIATIDIDNLIIADCDDALLIARKGSGQKVKEVVELLKQSGTNLHHIHRTAYRPWGSYTVLEDANGYKIKRIVVKPGQRLSLQKHLQRSEHWIVISGIATVTINNETKLVHQNESTYIRIGEMHRLANDGDVPVVLIEAQVGQYTGEDDIIRIQDDYLRNQ